MPTKDHLRALLTDLSDDDLRTLRAMINGKLGRRVLTREQAIELADIKKRKKEEGR